MDDTGMILYCNLMPLKMPKNIVRAYYDESYPPVPDKRTLFWRKNIIWQAVRFVYLNLKIMRIIVGGHS